VNGWTKVFILFAVFFITSCTCTLARADTNTVSSTVTGTTTVDKTPPTASAPSIVINNQDVCTTGTSVAVQTQILGFATGQTITDENCERLKLARSLYGMGMKVAAVSVLCQDQRVWDGMWMAGTPCPFLGSIGKEAKEKWETNMTMIPDGTTMFSTMTQNEQVKEQKKDKPKTKGESNEKSGLAIFGGLAALLFLL
jgi:hypothetical protein